MKEALITAAKPELETVSPNHANLPIQVACTQQKLQPESVDVPYNRKQTDGSEHNRAGCRLVAKVHAWDPEGWWVQPHGVATIRSARYLALQLGP